MKFTIQIKCEDDSSIPLTVAEIERTGWQRGRDGRYSGERGKGVKSNSNTEVRTPAERHAARACPASAASALGMTWAQRLKRVFNIDIEVCSLCGGSVRVIVEASNRCIEDQDVIPDKAGQALDRILDHLRQKERETPTRPLLLPRAWCHRPERHLERCHFSLGRIPDQQQPTSKEARETAWHERLRALVQD